jgi:hypothetical protein
MEDFMKSLNTSPTRYCENNNRKTIHKQKSKNRKRKPATCNKLSLMAATSRLWRYPPLNLTLHSPIQKTVGTLGRWLAWSMDHRQRSGV